MMVNSIEMIIRAMDLQMTISVPLPRKSAIISSSILVLYR